MSEQHVMITGASTGIGKACASFLIERGHHVWGSVRRPQDADRLVDEFGNFFRPLVFDVTDPDAITQAAETVAAHLEGQTLFGLVNNAGIAESGPLKDIDPDRLRAQLDINVIGPLRVTQAFLPLLGGVKGHQGNPGRIVNMSSVSGKRAFPFLGPYAMSKFALEAQSDALRRELMLYGIDVIVVQPGPIVTPIWDKAADLDVSEYQQSDYFEILTNFQSITVERGKQGLPAVEVAKVVHKALTLPKPKTRYVVTRNKFMNSTLLSFIPDRVLDRIIARQLGLQKDN